MLRIVQRYELDAKLRADRALTRLDEDLDLAFLQTDAVLMKAEMYTLPPVFSDARIHRQNYSEGLLVEYRRNLWVPHDRDATIDASWDFIPHQCPSKSMNFDHVSRQRGLWGILQSNAPLYCVGCEHSERFHEQRLFLSRPKRPIRVEKIRH